MQASVAPVGGTAGQGRAREQHDCRLHARPRAGLFPAPHAEGDGVSRMHAQEHAGVDMSAHPTCQHDLRVTPLHHPECVADAVHARGTCSRHCVVGAPQLVPYADCPRCHVDQYARHKVGRHAPQLGCCYECACFRDFAGAAHACAHADACDRLLLGCAGVPLRVSEGLQGGQDIIERVDRKQGKDQACAREAAYAGCCCCCCCWCTVTAWRHPSHQKQSVLGSASPAHLCCCDHGICYEGGVSSRVHPSGCCCLICLLPWHCCHHLTRQLRHVCTMRLEQQWQQQETRAPKVTPLVQQGLSAASIHAVAGLYRNLIQQ